MRKIAENDRCIEYSRGPPIDDRKWIREASDGSAKSALSNSRPDFDAASALNSQRRSSGSAAFTAADVCRYTSGRFPRRSGGGGDDGDCGKIKLEKRSHNGYSFPRAGYAMTPAVKRPLGGRPLRAGDVIARGGSAKVKGVAGPSGDRAIIKSCQLSLSNDNQLWHVHSVHRDRVLARRRSRIGSIACHE